MNRYLVAGLVPVLSVAAFFAVRAGMPPAGQCVDVELVTNEGFDAGRVSIQSPWRVCNLDNADASAAAILDRECRQAGRSLCGIDTDDEATRTREQRECLRAAIEQCQQSLPSSGGLVWTSQPYPVPEGETRSVSRLSRREQMQSSCACRNRVDAGICREQDRAAPGATPTGIDAGWHPAPYATTLQPGQWKGPGCVATPCVESEVREQQGGPGGLFASECR